MLFANSGAFISGALNNTTPINGMYVLYTNRPTTAVPIVSDGVITDANGNVTSGATLESLKAHIITYGGSVGLARTQNITPDTLTANATTVFYSTTDNAERICGIPFSAGSYARRVMLAHINKYEQKKDIALDYNECVATALPANGAITLIDKVTLS